MQDGKIIAAAQEERFTRKKHDASFPKKAVEFPLKQGGINTSDLDYVGFYDKPLQVVFLGVLAQVILSFLALSFYRWDINVRMPPA